MSEYYTLTLKGNCSGKKNIFLLLIEYVAQMHRKKN